jgi:hypothetical protein
MSVDWYWYVILIAIFLIIARGKIFEELNVKS